MKMNIKSFLCLICAVIFIQCDDTDKYYERPDWLEKPIYDVLKEEGHFQLYLQCVDSTEYAEVLKGAGLYTVFAPNDEAFSAYLQTKSYASVSDIPAEERNNLVAYSIVYSKWTSDRLSYYLVDGKYTPGAFKRKTNCYALPYKDSEFGDKWVFNQTTPFDLVNGYDWFSTNYQIHLAQNNYKYLPVYSQAYFNSFPEPLQAGDYNTFYPNSVYTGKNVQAGTILHEDIVAENGIIHEVSMVNEPLDNIDDILYDQKFSGFRALLDSKDTEGKNIFKKYMEVQSAHLDMFKKMRPKENIDNVYVKIYNSLSFSPILENIYSESVSGYSEISGNTLFVPENTVLQNFIQDKLLKYYGSIDKLPLEVISTFINTHMVSGLVWPSLYKSSMASTGEYLNGEGTYGTDFNDAGVVEKRVASNGFVYLIDNVIKSRYFETVYSEIFLNPAHVWLNQAYVNFYNMGLREDLMKSILTGYTSERYTMLNFSDNLLKADGFTYSAISNTFANDEMSSGSDDRLKRLMRMHIFPGLKNSEVDSEITGFDTAPISNYGGWGFLVNTYGDLIRYKDGKLQAAGNIEDNSLVSVTQVNDPYNNGVVFNVDKLLQYSPRETASADDRWKELTLWKYLDRARTQNPNVSLFVDYVEACLKNPDTDDLDGVKAENYYTVLMVNNAAINQAISRGYLPALSTIVSDGDLNARAKATQFLNAHFLSGTVIPDDGYKYIYPVNPMSPDKTILSTLLKITDEEAGLANASTKIEVSKSSSGLLTFMPENITLGVKIQVYGGFGTTSTMRVQRGKVTGTTLVDNYRSNRIACKAVLHEVNNFFTFTINNDN